MTHTDVAAPLRSTGLVQDIRDEYDEMPGLRLTFPQARRLFGLGASDAEAILGQLVAEGFLTVSTNGQYRRADTR
jgi:hypothetical protein